MRLETRTLFCQTQKQEGFQSGLSTRAGVHHRQFLSGFVPTSLTTHYSALPSLTTSLKIEDAGYTSILLIQFHKIYILISLDSHNWGGCTYLCNMVKPYNVDTTLLENEWHHVEVRCVSKEQINSDMEIGIHVLKDNTSMEDIRFTYPDCEEYVESHVCVQYSFF